jgi:hypothetical protein
MRRLPSSKRFPSLTKKRCGDCSGGEPAKHAKYAKRLQELHAQGSGCAACFACFAGYFSTPEQLRDAIGARVRSRQAWPHRVRVVEGNPWPRCASPGIFRAYRDAGGPRRHLIPDFRIAAHAHVKARLQNNWGMEIPRTANSNPSPLFSVSFVSFCSPHRRQRRERKRRELGLRVLKVLLGTSFEVCQADRLAASDRGYLRSCFPNLTVIHP